MQEEKRRRDRKKRCSYSYANDMQINAQTWKAYQCYIIFLVVNSFIADLSSVNRNKHLLVEKNDIFSNNIMEAANELTRYIHFILFLSYEKITLIIFHG